MLNIAAFYGDPEAPVAELELDAAGRLASLGQLGWKIRYDRYAEFDGLVLPTKLSAQRAQRYIEKTAETAVRFGSVYREIIACARSEGVDLIVMGSHAPNVADYLLGSNAARVVRHSPCSVHIVRPRPTS